MSSIYDESSHDPALWVRNIPELATRPRLVEKMRHWRALRRFIFKYHNICGVIAGIADTPTAIFLLSLYIKDVRQKVKALEERLDLSTEGDVQGELIGVIRNIYRNTKLRIHPHEGMQFNRLYDVKRKAS